MKKILAAFLILSIAFGFVACSSNDDYTPEPGKEGENGGDEEEEVNDDDLVLVDWKPNPKFSWSDDWNDPNSPNYKPEGYNPLEGVWRYVNSEKVYIFYSDRSTSKYSTIYYFGGMIHSYDTSSSYKIKINKNGYQEEHGYGNFISIYEYKIIDNILYKTMIYKGHIDEYNPNTPPQINNPVEILVKVENPQLFKWRGNWNDPKDPNYKQGGYNRLEGAWKNNDIYDGSGMIIDRNGIYTEAYFYGDTGYYTTYSSIGIRQYSLWLNDISFFPESLNSNNSGIDWGDVSSYKLKGNILEIYPVTSIKPEYITEKVENPIYSPIVEKFHEFEGKWVDTKNNKNNIIFEKVYLPFTPPPFDQYGIRGTLVNITSTNTWGGYKTEKIFIKNGSIISYIKDDGKSSVDIKYERVDMNTMKFTIDGKSYDMKKY